MVLEYLAGMLSTMCKLQFLKILMINCQQVSILVIEF